MIARTVSPAAARSVAGHKLADARPDPSAYQVIFAVISREPGDPALPFFSRLSLRYAARRLVGFGYRVAVAKIEASENYTKTKRYD